MSSLKQRTIQRPISTKGKACHTGEDVELTFKPAPIDHGIVFKRLDIYGKPEIKPYISQVGDLVRNTTIGNEQAKIHTVEHVLSALNGMGITNIIVEMTGAEPPILDGSSRPFTQLLQEAEPIDQDKNQAIFTLQEPIYISQGNRSIIAVPYDGFKITCTSSDDKGLYTQHLSLEINLENYLASIAPARTFAIYEEIESLIQLGKIKGGSLDCAILIKGDKIISKEPLRFPDEFVRHKILDIIGDVALLGVPLKAHIIAVRPGHALNAELTKKLAEQYLAYQKGHYQKTKLAEIKPHETQLDIRRVLNILPHRYPFVMIDKVLQLNDDNSLIAVKNVSINEGYFQGHFPGHPVMPGVLQVEAMAQAAGILLLRHVNIEGKLAFFMSCDQVKFRQSVVPGDQLMIHVKLLKVRGHKIATAQGECRVNDKVVSSAELAFALVDTPQDV